MKPCRRTRLCLLVPGHDLTDGSGLARYLCSLARALADHAEVTLVFRRLLAPAPADTFAVDALQGREAGATPGFWDFASSPRALGRFAERRLRGFDVVLEATWLQTGKVTAWCAQRGIPAIPLVDRLPVGGWFDAIATPGGWPALRASGRILRRAPCVIAGSEALREEITRRWRVPAERVEVIERGVDRRTFEPREQKEARARLGIDPEERVLLYGGPLDEAHDLTPLLDAASRAGDRDLRIHILGDGPAREDVERAARAGTPLVLHPRVPGVAVPEFVAAADLCVAVEDPRFLSDGLEWGGAVAVAECLVAGRPVAVGMRARGEPLVRHRVSGFHVEHDVLSWIRFLQRECPSRNTLRIMGKAASATPLPPIEATAAAYLALCERVRRAA